MASGFGKLWLSQTGDEGFLFGLSPAGIGSGDGEHRRRPEATEDPGSLLDLKVPIGTFTRGPPDARLPSPHPSEVQKQVLNLSLDQFGAILYRLCGGWDG
ncbi:hypothetical protein [Streptomyces phaeoluteigriseus]|uniref:hypothetical protein n=1 Tax=Streptomyces phaeoluteigriseus TaxID=114686 RepID=UPI00368D0CE9